MQGSRTGRVAVAMLFAAIAACSDDVSNPASVTNFRGTLNGASEKPTAVITNASGTATFALSGGNITFTVNYSGLSGAPSASHIHVGAPNQSGAVQLNLCGTGATFPVACPTVATGSFTGTAAAAHLVGTGVTMETVLSNMRGFNAYVNVHTAANGGGEIRGNIVGVP